MHGNRLITAKTQVYQEFEFRHKIAGKGDFEGDVADALVPKRDREGSALRMQRIDSGGAANRQGEDHLLLPAQGLLRIPFTVFEDLRFLRELVEDGANR